MNTLFKRSLSKVAVAFCAAATLVAGSPAIANTNANANATASADVTEPVADVGKETLSSGDQRFSELFASWTALDEAGPGAPIVQKPAISVPSLMPVATARMSSGYGMRDHPVLRKRKRHSGVDLAAPTGTPVYATANGIVERADRFSSYGLYISIDHGGDLETRYAHLSRLAVSAGERVEKGEVIGYVGSTGRSTGPHLHYEVRVDGVAVNPIPYMVQSENSTETTPEGQRIGQGGP